MFVSDQPAAINFEQNRCAPAAPGRFLAVDQALPSVFVMARCHVIRHRSPGDVVNAKLLLLNQGESLFKGGPGRCFSCKRVFSEDEHGIISDVRSNFVPGMPVEYLDIVGKGIGMIHALFSGREGLEQGKQQDGDVFHVLIYHAVERRGGLQAFTCRDVLARSCG